ncbi:MAG: hypothetical protein M3Y26_05475, partial [Actinomycetota bacterium]|nr:hypothetical protein [Actinomycetota bacterium]
MGRRDQDCGRDDGADSGQGQPLGCGVGDGGGDPGPVGGQVNAEGLDPAGAAYGFGAAGPTGEILSRSRQ